jgi:DnaJ homolog subfamily A member 5
MTSSAAGAPKRCYYEILGLSRDCSPTDIKLAFRRLALSLHPDKQSPGSDIAAATAAFQELQHAHSVLSDPHERAYYDSHRSQILFSDPSASASPSPVPDLFAFFSSSAFSGFADTGRGFYKVYGDVFDKVFAQELAYAHRMGVHEPASPPVIGNLDSPYAQVTAFYSYWLGFASVMDFGWAAEWDAARGENRRVRRLMEEDNKKATRKARREYNDAVRGLAAFCKKRDKRVVDMALKKKAEEEKRKADERARKKEEERRKKERAMAYQEPEWARVEEEEGVFDEEEEEEIRAKRKEELYCVACNKKFKSDKQWKNHEQSKKHRDKIAELRMVFKEEEETLKEEAEGDGDEVDVGFDFKPAEESNENESEWSDAAEELAEELDNGLEVNDKDDSGKDLGDAEQEVGSYDETSILEAMLSSRKKKKGGYVPPPSEASSGGVELLDNDDISEFNNVKKKGHKRRASKKEQGESTYADNEQQRKPEVRPEDSGHDNDENGVDDKMEGPSSSNEGAASASNGDQQKGKNSNPKKNKKDKKATEKKPAVSTDQKSTSKGKKQKVHLRSLFVHVLYAYVCNKLVMNLE